MMNENLLRAICQMIASGEIPSETREKYLGYTGLNNRKLDADNLVDIVMGKANIEPPKCPWCHTKMVITQSSRRLAYNGKADLDTFFFMCPSCLARGPMDEDSDGAILKGINLHG